MKISFIYILSLLCALFSHGVHSEDKLIVFHDSTKHRIINVPMNIYYQAFDLGKSGKIHKEINRRLGNLSSLKKTPDELKKIVAQGLQSNPQMKLYIEQLNGSYGYLKKVAKYQITKIPAVVLDTEDGEYVVYGQTNIQKALENIAVYRRSSGM
jgi:integrating conjugative element protein (TIGR03757 family)